MDCPESRALIRHRLPHLPPCLMETPRNVFPDAFLLIVCITHSLRLDNSPKTKHWKRVRLSFWLCTSYEVVAVLPSPVNGRETIIELSKERSCIQ